jgi:hypothetical protein
MSPDDPLLRCGDTPRAHTLAANQRSKHLCFNSICCNKECLVAPGFDAQRRPADRALGQRNSCAADFVERLASVRREQNPRTARRLIERKSVTVSAPSGDTIVLMNPYRDLYVGPVLMAASSPSYYQRWINSSIERLLRVREVVHLEKRSSVLEKCANSTTCQ